MNRIPLTGRRRFALAAALAAAIASAYLLVRPFVAEASTWTWRPGDTTARSLINAEQTATPYGLELRPRPGRAMSVVSPEADIDAGGYAAIDIECAFPDAPPAATVRAMWQPIGAVNYRFESQIVSSTSDFVVVRIPVAASPHWRGRVARVGVQWPDASRVIVRRVSLVTIPTALRPRLAWQQLLGREDPGNTAANYLAGMPILGHGLNYYLLFGAALALAIHGVVRLTRGRQLSWLVTAHVVLVAWLLADVHATAGLARQAAVDLSSYAASDDAAGVAFGSELAAARDLIQRHSPPDASVAVLSDDDYYPWQRLRYLLAPQRAILPADGIRQSRFLLLYFASSARFDPSTHELTLPDGALQPVRLVGQSRPEVQLFEWVAP